MKTDEFNITPAVIEDKDFRITPEMVEALETKDEVTKAEAAVLLSFTEKALSIRAIERYVQDEKLRSVEQHAGGRGRAARFKTADVLALRSAMRRAGEQVALQRREGRESLTPTKTERAVVGVVGELIERQTQFGERLVKFLEQHFEMTERLGEKLASEIARRDPRPVWLTRAGALEVSGLPASVIEKAIKDELLHPIGKGRGWRLNRDELLAFSVSLAKGGAR